MPGVSAQELAELVPCSVEFARLGRLGFFAAFEDGRFPPAGVHVVRPMAAFEEAGISLDDVAREGRAGRAEVPDGALHA